MWDVIPKEAKVLFERRLINHLALICWMKTILFKLQKSEKVYYYTTSDSLITHRERDKHTDTERHTETTTPAGTHTHTNLAFK